MYPQAALKPDHTGYLPLYLSVYASETWNSRIKEIFKAALDSNLNNDKNEQVNKVEDQKVFNLPTTITHTSSTFKDNDGNNSNNTLSTLVVHSELNNNPSICSNH